MQIAKPPPLKFSACPIYTCTPRVLALQECSTASWMGSWIKYRFGGTLSALHSVSDRNQDWVHRCQSGCAHLGVKLHLVQPLIPSLLKGNRGFQGLVGSLRPQWQNWGYLRPVWLHVSFWHHCVLMHQKMGRVHFSAWWLVLLYRSVTGLADISYPLVGFTVPGRGVLIVLLLVSWCTIQVCTEKLTESLCSLKSPEYRVPDVSGKEIQFS